MGPYSNDEAIGRIQSILQHGRVEPTYHCLRDSMASRGVELSDVLHALSNGRITRPPEFDTTFNNWKYRVEGWDVEGDELTVITVILETNLLLRIITVF